MVGPVIVPAKPVVLLLASMPTTRPIDASLPAQQSLIFMQIVSYGNVFSAVPEGTLQIIKRNNVYQFVQLFGLHSVNSSITLVFLFAHQALTLILC